MWWRFGCPYHGVGMSFGVTVTIAMVLTAWTVAGGAFLRLEGWLSLLLEAFGSDTVPGSHTPIRLIAPLAIDVNYAFIFFAFKFQYCLQP